MTGVEREAARYERELLTNPELAEEILHRLGPLAELERRVLIRCSRENVDRAIAKALARAVAHREVCKIEIESCDDERKV